MDAIANAAPAKKRKLTALPLLVVLFVISYLLLTKLVIEQDKTIDSQRSMIHMLFKDNAYLSKLHVRAGESSKNAKSRGSSQLQAQTPASQDAGSASSSNRVSSTQIPFVQVPSTQVPLTQAPSSKSGPQANTKIDHKNRKAQKTIPASPPAELTDPSDQRRVSFSI